MGPAHYGQSGGVLDIEPTFSLLASSFGRLGWVYGVFEGPKSLLQLKNACFWRGKRRGKGLLGNGHFNVLSGDSFPIDI